jgi:hypothetical protein
MNTEQLVQSHEQIPDEWNLACRTGNQDMTLINYEHSIEELEKRTSIKIEFSMASLNSWI